MFPFGLVEEVTEVLYLIDRLYSRQIDRQY